MIRSVIRLWLWLCLCFLSLCFAPGFPTPVEAKFRFRGGPEDKCRHLLLTEFLYTGTDQWDRWPLAYPGGFVSTEVSWSKGELFIEGAWADSEDADVLVVTAGVRVQMDRGRFRLGSGVIRPSNGSTWPNPPLFSWTFTGRHRAG